MWAHNGLGKGKLLLPISVQDQDPDLLQPLDIVSLLKIADLTDELVEKKKMRALHLPQCKVGQPNPPTNII